MPNRKLQSKLQSKSQQVAQLRIANPTAGAATLAVLAYKKIKGYYADTFNPYDIKANRGKHATFKRRFKEIKKELNPKPIIKSNEEV